MRGRYWVRVDDRRRDVLLLHATYCDRLYSNWSSMSPQCDQIPECLNVSKIHGNLCKDIHKGESATALLIFGVCPVNTLAARFYRL